MLWKGIGFWLSLGYPFVAGMLDDEGVPTGDQYARAAGFKKSEKRAIPTSTAFFQLPGFTSAARLGCDKCWKIHTRPTMNSPHLRATREVASWIPPIARLGYAAKGVVYLLIGWIAIKAGLASGSPEGSTGALASLVDEKGGQLMLVVIAIGLLAHVIWRAVQALLDPEHHGSGAKRLAVRLFYALSGLIYGSLAWTAWQLSQSGKGGSGNGNQVWVSRLLEKPFGTWLVMLAGMGVAVYGAYQIYKGWQGDLGKRMPGAGPRVRLLGRMGIAARGVVLMPIGWFVFEAGRHYNAAQAADTQQVLKMLDQGWLLGVVGLGLMAYGVYQMAKAMYRRIERPA